MARLLILLACLCPAAPAGRTADPPDTPPAGQVKTRTFLFSYAATVTGLRPGQAAKIWLPVPPTNDDQTVQVASRRLPGKVQRTREDVYGNEFFYAEAAADGTGVIPLEVTYRVERREARGDLAAPVGPVSGRFLQPDRLVPTDGKPLALLAGKKLSGDRGRLARDLFDIVNGHMTYGKKGEGWGRGDAVWACDSRYGNCTDFHSLFIALARSQKIPARFEIGFALPPGRGRGEVAGYHCWAQFLPGGKSGWVPVDISLANQVRDTDPGLADYCFGNLTEDRVAFSVGRDLVLSPEQSGPPLNFLVYPYVEVDGREYPADRVVRRFQFQDTAGDGD